MATSERVAEVLAARDSLDADERAEFDAALRPEKAEPDYETPIVLVEPMDLGKGRDERTEIRCVNRPRMAHFIIITKAMKDGIDHGTMMLKVGYQLTGLRVEDAMRLCAKDASAYLVKIGEWLSPFESSIPG